MGAKLPAAKSDKPMAIRHVKEHIKLDTAHAAEHRAAKRSISDKDRLKYHDDHIKGHVKHAAKKRKQLAKIKEV